MLVNPEQLAPQKNKGPSGGVCQFLCSHHSQVQAVNVVSLNTGSERYEQNWLLHACASGLSTLLMEEECQVLRPCPQGTPPSPAPTHPHHAQGAFVPVPAPSRESSVGSDSRGGLGRAGAKASLGWGQSLCGRG